MRYRVWTLFSLGFLFILTAVFVLPASCRHDGLERADEAGPTASVEATLILAAPARMDEFVCKAGGTLGRADQVARSGTKQARR